MNRFETTHVICAATLQEIKHFLVPHYYKYLMPFMIAIHLFYMFLALMKRNLISFIFGVVFIVFLILLYDIFCRQVIRNNLTRMNEVYGKPERLVITSFDDTGMTDFDVDSGDRTHLLYQHFVRFGETEHFYVLRTKSGLILFINKDTILQTGQREALFDWLHQYCPQLRLR